jgi:hypothetical protein
VTVNGGDVIKASDVNDGPRLIARHKRTSNASATSGTTEKSIMRIDGIALTGGKIYRICTNRIIVDGSVANDSCRLVLRVSNSGTATTSSTQLAIDQKVVPNISLPEGLLVDADYAPAGDETLSVLVSYVRQSGTGVFQALGDPTFPMLLRVFDSGDDPGDTGTDL